MVRDIANRRLAWGDQVAAIRQSVPTGGLLVPTIGVGGHCLPKDGILLLWRMIEAGADMSSSLILESRRINDESPGAALGRIESLAGPVAGRKTALLGASYRPNSEDTRNSPTLALALQILARRGRVAIHDPYVRPEDQNLARTGLAGNFARDFDEAVAGADVVTFCVSHRVYQDGLEEILRELPAATCLFDGCHIGGRETGGRPFPGIGKGRLAPPEGLVEAVVEGFQAVERGVALELDAYVRFINEAYADSWNRLDLDEIRDLAGTCPTGCRIGYPGPVPSGPPKGGFVSRLVAKASSLAGRAFKEKESRP
jgi:hypothetical protein